MISAKIQNSAVVSQDLKKLKQKIREGIQEALIKGAEDIREKAQHRVPDKTGRLKESLTTVFEPGDLRVYVGTTVSYARFVEFGTRRIPARPFLLPAAEETFPFVMDTLTQALNYSFKG